ncbi:MAG: hypothetical protein H6621_08525 [Halobacteriovoraceae bacterium]|nr:hypothetical protein [Halobacteriovoraceae bacterium]
MGLKLITLSLFITLSACLQQGSRSSGSAAVTPEGVQSELCQGGEECFGQMIKGGYDHDDFKRQVATHVVFINASSELLVDDPETAAREALDEINTRFRDKDGHQHLKFYLQSFESVIDDLFFIGSCEDLDSMLDLYGKANTFTLLFNYELLGACNGVAHLWTLPEDKYSGFLVEYDGQLDSLADVAAHELAHNLGLHHSANTYDGSVPLEGLHDFNKLLDYGARFTGRCEQSFYYFIDPLSGNSVSRERGFVFNSYHHLMYPSYGDDVQRSFFTSGYDYSSSQAFNCWMDQFKKNGRGVVYEIEMGKDNIDNCDRLELRGDYDGDGQITSNDYELIYDKEYRRSTGDLRFDFNNDYTFNDEDLDYIQKYLAGLVCN